MKRGKKICEALKKFPTAFQVIKPFEWYNNYCFSVNTSTMLFNPDMVFYFVQNFMELGRPPDDLTGEKVIQTFLLAYLNVTDYYLTRTEEELGKGWVDLYLEPFWQKYPDVRHGYLIELKYVKRDEWSEARGQAEVQAATGQLQQYTNASRVSRSPHLTGVALVFCGWELKIAEEVPGL